MDYEAIVEKMEEIQQERWDNNSRFVGTSEYKKNFPGTALLEKHTLKWEPRDRRFQDPDADEPELTGREALIYDGTEMVVIGTRPRENAITFGIYIPCNIAEFKAYNKIVEGYNASSDRPVRTRCPESRYRYDIDLDPNHLDSIPDVPVPKTRRKKVGILEAQLDIVDNDWVIKAYVKNNDNEVVFWSEIVDDDLSMATLRLIDHLFGTLGYRKSKLSGLELLLTGKKFPSKKKPEWVIGKTKRTKVNSFNIVFVLLLPLHWLLRTIVPAASCLVGVWYLLLSMGDFSAFWYALLYGVVIPYLCFPISDIILILYENSKRPY